MADDKDNTTIPTAAKFHPWDSPETRVGLARSLETLATEWALIVDANPTDAEARRMLDILDAVHHAQRTGDSWLKDVAGQAKHYLGSRDADRVSIAMLKDDLKEVFVVRPDSMSPERKRLLEEGLDLPGTANAFAAIRRLAQDFVIRLSMSRLRAPITVPLGGDDDWPAAAAVDAVSAAFTKRFRDSDERRRKPGNLVVAALIALGAPRNLVKDFYKDG